MNLENCLICGSKIEYNTQQVERECSLCKDSFMSNARCTNGHYVCDQCHRSKGLEVIEDICLSTDSRDPICIIQEIMNTHFIHMHGPEHHIMVGASLLAAYKNAGGQVELDKAMKEMIERGSQIPGGVCGFWGCCGAAVSSGIFLSLITGATPMSEENRGVAQRTTATALTRISHYGGPRCCKRDSFLSILSTIDFIREHLGIQMGDGKEKIVCEFSSRNRECLGTRCEFFNKAKNIDKNL